MEFKLPESNGKAALVVASLATLLIGVIGLMTYFFGPAPFILAMVFGVTFFFAYIFIDIYRWEKGHR